MASARSPNHGLGNPVTRRFGAYGSIDYRNAWEKSTKICSAYHPGRAPCLFPSDFCPQTKTDRHRNIEALVGSCSVLVYYKQCHAIVTSGRGLNDIMNEDSELSNREDLRPSSVAQLEFSKDLRLPEVLSNNNAFRRTLSPIAKVHASEAASNTARTNCNWPCSVATAPSKKYQWVDIPPYDYTEQFDARALNISRESWWCKDQTDSRLEQQFAFGCDRIVELVEAELTTNFHSNRLS